MSEQKPFAEVKPEEAAEIVKAEKTVLLDVRYGACPCIQLNCEEVAINLPHGQDHSITPE